MHKENVLKLAEDTGAQDMDREDLYAALLHEMKNTLVLMTMTLADIPHTGENAHDKSLDEARLLCQRTSERLMQALFVYKHFHDDTVLNAVDAYPLEDFLEEMAIQARSLRANLNIEIHIDETLPALWFFDRNMLEMALLNGLHNSLTYARERVQIRAGLEDGMLCIGIEDDSSGYPEHILEAIATGKPLKASGTGLGLRFASMIARAHTNEGHQGRLRLRNDPGAIFEMLIP